MAKQEASDMGMAKVCYLAILDQTPLGIVLSKMSEMALRREKLELSIRVLAQVICAMMTGRQETCGGDPGNKWSELAVQILLRVASGSTRKAMAQGKLRGLGAVSRDGIVWVSGRIRGATLAAALGTANLPIVMASEALGRRILSKSHRQDHRRDPKDITARSRQMVWIPGATRAAKEIAAKCFSCRNTDKQLEKKLMGQLPEERTAHLAPF